MERIRMNDGDKPRKGKNRIKGKRGGLRPGGGRPQGSENRFSKEAREKALLSGDELPHEQMLNIARMRPGDRIGKGKHAHTLTFDDIKWAMKESAGYFQPKLASTTLQGDPSRPLSFVQLDPEVLRNMSPRQLSALQSAMVQLGNSGVTQPLGLPAPDAKAYADTLGARTKH